MSLAVNLKLHTPYVSNVDLQIPTASHLAIYGHSGAGKTTLLKAIAGLLPNNAFSNECNISWNGNDFLKDKTQTASHLRKTSFVFQNSRLFSHLNVEGNLLYALKRSLNPNTQDQFIDLCEKFSLTHLLTQSVNTLSAGECQRVALLRSLLFCPELLLMDEPLSHIDQAQRMKLLPLIKQYCDNFNCTLIYISHQLNESLYLCDQLLVLESGNTLAQGSIHEVLPFLQSQSSISHDNYLLGDIKNFDEEYQLTEIGIEGHSIFIPHHANKTDNVSQAVVLHIAAKDISLNLHSPQYSSILNTVPITIESIATQNDSYCFATFSITKAGNHRPGAEPRKTQQCTAQITRKSADSLHLRVGDQLFASIKSAALQDSD